MKSLLIEIGCEEIPARFLNKGAEILENELTARLDNSSIDHGNSLTYYTPRRLTVLIRDVAGMQNDVKREILGPPKKVAFDKDGNPTKAAEGFARSLDIGINNLGTKKTGKGDYVYAVVEEKGRPAIEVLSEIIPDSIKSLQLPKSMRWGNSDIRFFRPIHWILAIHGSDIIPFDIDGITSSNITRGHRFLSPAAITISDPDQYIESLKSNAVLVDPVARRDTILNEIDEFENSSQSIVNKDQELLDTVTNLVEFPNVVIGRFDDQFLSLPRELLITVMKTHQKYFSVENKNGEMSSSFIVVSNTDRNNHETVRKGAERVLRARLEDASFYFREDRQKRLTDRVEDLKRVAFHEKLGNLYEKALRISANGLNIAKLINFGEKEKIRSAAMLCKADLVTGVVGEFPELQGYMGKIYALESGEDADVATAIHEHYLPRFAGDDLPSGDIGSIIALADRIDNIACFFSINLIPTGSEDPFALRRQASGILNILLNRQYNIPLRLLINTALENLKIEETACPSLTEQLLNFFRTRLEGIFSSRGFRYDLINAALHADDIIPDRIDGKIEVLSSLCRDERFPALLTAAKRVFNILSKATRNDLNESMLTKQAEKRLCSAVKETLACLKVNQHESIFDLEEPINDFFENILVMDKDETIKQNRLALLFKVKDVFNELGDFSLIAE